MSEYVPKEDPEFINAPPGTPLRDLLILLVGAFAGLALLIGIAVFFTEQILSRVSIEQELKTFRWLWPKEPAEARYPAEFQKLVEVLKHNVEFPVEISFSCMDEPNAFALPGGRIILTVGLLDYVKSENGLMFVLGHEVGHIQHRDHIKQWGRHLSLAVLRGLLGFESNLSSLQALEVLVQRGFDRTQEAKADQNGLRLLEKIYGHAAGAEEFFSALSKREKFSEKIPQIFLTHPHSSERIAELESASKEGILTFPTRPFSEWKGEIRCD